MASTFSPNKGYELMATGENTGTWGTKTNDNLDIIDLNLGGVLGLSLSSTNVTLTTSQAQNVVYQLTGTLSASVQITWPIGDGGIFIVRNATSGAFSVTLASAGGGTSTTCTQGTTRFYFTDGTNIREAVTLGTAAQYNTGTSGGTVPLLNGANTWSAAQSMTAGGTLGNDSGDAVVIKGTTVSTYGATILDSTSITNLLDDVGATASRLMWRGVSTWQQQTLQAIMAQQLGSTKGQIAWYDGSTWTVLNPP